MMRRSKIRIRVIKYKLDIPKALISKKKVKNRGNRRLRREIGQRQRNVDEINKEDRKSP